MISVNHASEYCSEDISLIENYNLAVSSPERWCVHHRKGVEDDMSKEELLENGLYKKRPASELIFIPMSEHRRMHTSGEKNPFYGKRHSEAQKAKWSKTRHGIYSNGAKKSNEAKKIPVIVHKNGVFFGEFSSNLEASKKTGVSRHAIQRFLNGTISRNRSGFVFQRKTSF